MRVGCTPPSPLPVGGTDGGGGGGGWLPGTRTGVGCVGLMPLLEKALKEATENMPGIIGRIG